eukprot:2306053-Prymnesium_polylepis.2
MTLGLTFVLVPSTSTRIFKTFLCDLIQYDDASSDTRQYLQVDLTLNCDSDDYVDTRNTALVMLAIWPVGIPVMYAVLLLATRSTLRKGIQSPLSRATSFLYGDYAKHAFLWEPLEMCRKLALTGKRAVLKWVAHNLAGSRPSVPLVGGGAPRTLRTLRTHYAHTTAV